MNKIIRITSEGLELEADPRHAEVVVQDLGLAEAKPTRAPGIQESSKKSGVDGRGDGDEK